MYEIHPCRLIGNNYERCAPDTPDIAVWGLYTRNDDGTAVHLSDHGTKTHALAAIPPAVIGLVAMDHYGNRESWRKICVLNYTGRLPTEDDLAVDHLGCVAGSLPSSRIDEDAILRRAEDFGFHIRSHGNGVPGHAYANAPLVTIYKAPIVIEQSGGLDV